MSSIKIYETQQYFVVIIIVHHELDLDKPVSSSPMNLFKGLSSRLPQFGL